MNQPLCQILRFLIVIQRTFSRGLTQQAHCSLSKVLKLGPTIPSDCWSWSEVRTSSSLPGSNVRQAGIPFVVTPSGHGHRHLPCHQLASSMSSHEAIAQIVDCSINLYCIRTNAGPTATTLFAALGCADTDLPRR